MEIKKRRGRPPINGLSSHRLYKIWKEMLNKTQNENSKDYKYYGERGILVCERWNKLENFIEDMFGDFKEGLQLDRKDNDGNYEKKNCRWVERTIQNRNTRRLRISNTSGYRGVSFDNTKKKWSVYISVNSKRINLGSFIEIEDAKDAYDNYVIENKLEHTTNIDDLTRVS